MSDSSYELTDFLIEKENLILVLEKANIKIEITLHIPSKKKLKDFLGDIVFSDSSVYQFGDFKCEVIPNQIFIQNRKLIFSVVIPTKIINPMRKYL